MYTHEAAGANVGSAFKTRVRRRVQRRQSTHLCALRHHAVADSNEDALGSRRSDRKWQVRRGQAGVRAQAPGLGAAGTQSAVKFEHEEQVG